MDYNICNNTFLKEFNKIIHNLNIIQHLDINEKLTIHNELFKVDNVSYIQGLYRWWSASSRIKTIKFINKLYKDALHIKKDLKIKDINIISNKFKKIIKKYLNLLEIYLKNSINGLNNLRTTYINDTVFCKKINLIIYNLENNV